MDIIWDWGKGLWIQGEMFIRAGFFNHFYPLYSVVEM